MFVVEAKATDLDCNCAPAYYGDDYAVSVYGWQDVPAYYDDSFVAVTDEVYVGPRYVRPCHRPYVVGPRVYPPRVYGPRPYYGPRYYGPRPYRYDHPY
jgi:hypothetical protein